MRYISVKVTSSFFAPNVISYSNCGVIGDGMNSALPSEPFLLTKPSGDNFDKLNTSSPLYQAVVDYFSQPNTTNLWVLHSSSDNAQITDEPMSVIEDTDNKQFQVQSTHLVSIEKVSEMVNGNLEEISPSEYTTNLTSGIITFNQSQSETENKYKPWVPPREKRCHHSHCAN